MSLVSWLDRTILAARCPPSRLGLVARLLGVAALIKGIDLHLALPAVLAGAALEGETPAWSLLPGPAAAALVSSVWLAASVLLALRLAPRLGAAVLATTGLWLSTVSARLYSNHLYLLALLTLLLALAPARGGTSGEAPGWPARLMQIQLSLVYGFGALAKLNPSFLSGEVLAVTSTLAGAPGPLLALASGAAVAVEAFLALALWSPRLRAWAMAAGVALHTGILLVLPFDLGLVAFAVACLAVYPLFAGERRAA